MSKKFVANPMTASEHAITMLMDTSSPLILEIQLFWFDPKIAIFLEREMFWQASNGIRVGSLLDFTYTPLKQDSTKRSPYVGYLLGFGSNMHSKCYDKARILFESEDEKLRHAALIESAVNELVQAAMSIQTSSSPWFRWDIGK